ncbi:MAG: hypothetical protein EOP47_03960 [Sphingobacteriaceae bacterium]|nr:MAG: hypothetical protein EOP47_03960 [Sphingobacteriaceae bacterium]
MCKKGISILFIVFLAALSLGVQAQVRQKMEVVSSYNTARMPEKIFVHTDKWNYNKGDTLWFKTYVFDATMAATNKTGLMYIEIANSDNKIINRNMVALTNGTGWGSVFFKPERYPEGTYTMRAYTNWMRNFDEQDIYSRQFNIDGELDDEKWMINSRYELTENEGVNNVKTSISLQKQDGKPILMEDIQVKILDRLWKLNSAKLNTGVDSKLEFNFNVPAKTKISNINIELTKKTKKQDDVVYTVPVVINRDEKADMQFMPEGGNMVLGINGRIGFKAINEEGQGVDVSGGVYNSKGEKLTDITSIHKGMGSFNLKPELNEKYTARVNYKGKQISFKLPEAKASGMIINVDNITNKDSIIIHVNASTDIKQAGAMYYLVAQSRNVVCYGANVNTAKNTIRLSAPKAAFPTGVARFTLLSQLNKPITERIVYVDHHDQIRLSITPSKTTYANRDSVTLEIAAADKDGNPVQGTFSVAVTDDLQARPDTSGYGDINAKVLLADDLKGNIENPGWYFTKGDTIKKAKALDALMLTQGWVSYDWDEVFSTKQKPLAYKPEPEFVVRGKVTNAFNKKLEKTNVILVGKDPSVILETQTNEDGEFLFTGLTPSDTVRYHIQAKNKRDKAFNIGTKLEEFIAPVFTSVQQRQVPLYVNIDTARLVAIRTKQLYNAEEEKVSGTKLKEVTIKERKIVQGSKTLVEEPDLTLNKEDLEGRGKLTLRNILNKIPGFTFKGRRTMIGDKFTHFIVDGRFELSSGGATGRVSGLDRNIIFDHIGVEDIKGIEVMTTDKNVIKYIERFVPIGALVNVSEHSFIEITTYSGKGFTKQIPGAEVYQPPVFAAKKEFYSPQYTVKKPTVGVDVRATIFWSPNVVTDEKGKATIGFYTADKTATYTVNVQGSNMEGLVGAQQTKLNVKAGEIAVNK